jgi:tellurite resistance protein
MFPLKTDTPFTREQVVTVTRAMLQIAHVDGAGTAEEVAMIGQFYDGCRSREEDEWPEFVALCGSFAEASVSAALFPAMDQREMIAATCVMVAFADGEMTRDELSALRALSESLGIPDNRFEQILALVKDHMLMHLAGLPDTESIIAVTRELG